jgi:hypothetical protein
MLARVQIDTTTWQPLTYCQPLCSDTELWQLQGWHNWTRGDGSGGAADAE